MKAELKITSNIEQRLTVLHAMMPAINRKAMAAVGLQLINNIANGSKGNPIVPPILTGLLRGSGSVFFERSYSD